MELYQWVALSLMAAMGFVVHSTLRLNGFRKEQAIKKDMINLRDLSVLRKPAEYEPQEVYLVRLNWAACAAMFALFTLLAATSPKDVLQRLEAQPPIEIQSPAPKD